MLLFVEYKLQIVVSEEECGEAAFSASAKEHPPRPTIRLRTFVPRDGKISARPYLKLVVDRLYSSYSVDREILVSRS
jgi:hypothetical protein